MTSAVDRLLEEMDRGGDFPALSSTIAEINSAIGNENSRANVLTDIVLRDIALTKKLLRLVNAAYLGTFNGQPVSTVSRAVVLLGFDAVRDAAVSLLLIEHLNNRAQVDELKGEVVDSFYRGILGRLLASSAGVRDSEEAFIGALFRDLGRLMARFHFYEKTQHIQQLMQEEGLEEDAAARRVLGADYDQLGLAITRHWHFPPIIQQAITPLPPSAVQPPNSDVGRLRVVANLARELHRALAGKSREAQEQGIEALARRYRVAAHVSKESLIEKVRQAVEVLRGEAAILNVDPNQSTVLAAISRGVGCGGSHKDAEAARPPPEIPEAEAEDPTCVLTQGVQDMTATLLGEYQIGDIIKMVAEIFYRAQLFDRVLVCVRDPASQAMVARVGLGPDVARLRDAFRVSLSGAPDVFHAAITQSQDILVSDAGADNIRARIPVWYTEAAGAHSFLLLPLALDSKPLALLYADRRNAPLHLAPQVLALLKALRNQVALALRQKR